MKIGILTFHSQLNYGGVLQCWALQTALERAGHEAVVLDRWLRADNYALDRGFSRYGLLEWAKFAARAACGLGDRARLARVSRTKRFIKERLHLTPRHFTEWREYSAAIADGVPGMAVDAVVVGSDQVWHCGDFGDPRAYLLEGAPPVPAVSYAASFGMASFPESFTVPQEGTFRTADAFRAGLARFRAVSCREAEGVRLCAGLGVEAAHVADPTLLLPRDVWLDMIGMRGGGRRNRLVCYFLSEDAKAAMPLLDGYARRTGSRVDVFVDYGAGGMLPFPKSAATARMWADGVARASCGRVRIRAAAGPLEFVRALAGAGAVLSDSFHALMFSAVFGRNVRILRPASAFRRGMFGRIEEFAEHASGPLLADGIARALDSLEKGERTEIDGAWMETRRLESLAWLRGVLEACRP